MSLFKNKALSESELSLLPTNDKRMPALSGGLDSFLNLVLLKGNIFILASLSKTSSSFF